MKRSTTGLNVRFFGVRIATGHGRFGRSTGNTFNPNRSPPREQQMPEALGVFHKTEIERWWPIIKAAKIKAE